MLFYSYCPECGTESKPFQTEPKDGTPMTCRYCGKVYPYKTRHWMGQRIFIRSIFLIFVLSLIVRGCYSLIWGGNEVEDVQFAEAFDDGSVKKVYRVKSPKKRIVLKEDRIDVKKGLCAGYEWGSKKRDSKNEMIVALNGQLGWDDIMLFYGKGGKGLASFTLTKHGIRMDEFGTVIEKLTGPWVRSSGKTDLVTFDKGNSSITILLPYHDFRILTAAKAYEDGKKVDVNFSVVNEEIEKSEKDIEDVLIDDGWSRHENSNN